MHLLTPTPRRLHLGRWTLTGAVLAILLTASACGGDTPSSPAPQNGSPTAPATGSAQGSGGADTIRDACTLLSPADIERITGKAYDEGVIDSTLTSAEQSACVFDPADGGLDFVLVVVNNTGSPFAPHRQEADDNFDTPTEDVDGVGDEAFWAAIGTVATHVGPTFVQVSLYAGDKATVTELARAALANL
jgi:hypothetical protein